MAVAMQERCLATGTPGAKLLLTVLVPKLQDLHEVGDIQLRLSSTGSHGGGPLEAPRGEAAVVVVKEVKACLVVGIFIEEAILAKSFRLTHETIRSVSPFLAEFVGINKQLVHRGLGHTCDPTGCEPAATRDQEMKDLDALFSA